MSIKKITRLTIYGFFLVVTAVISALFGSKKNDYEQGNHISLVPTVAYADHTSPGDSPGPAPSAGSDCDSGSDSGDCCE